MHEYSIVAALVERVEAEAESRGATAVHHIRVRIGELSGVESDRLASAYELFRERTVCAAADLEIVSVPARWACPKCGGEIESGQILQCPACSMPARLQDGGEILLERIEMEVA